MKFRTKIKMWMVPVDENIRIGDLLRSYPETETALKQAGMHCLGCPSAQAETIKEACLVHGLDPKDVLNNVKNAIQ